MSISQKFLVLLAAIFAMFALASCDEESIGFGTKLKIGDAAPRSANLTVEDQNRWYEVSTMDTKVPLYKWSIAQLIDEGKPFLVVFGTPQHCTMCVDQIVRIAVMEEKYGDSFPLVHVDGYKDNDVWVEWGVKGEPWTYFVDQKGKVASIFPGQTELGLLEHEIEKLLSRS